MNKFDEVLKTRREEVRRHRSRALEMQRKREKKEQRKNIIIVIMFIIALITMIGLAMKLGQDFTNDCTQVHSKTYCERGL